MNKILEFFRDGWIEAQLKAPPFAQRNVIRPLHEAKEIARLLVGPYLPVCRLYGQGKGGPLTVSYVGWSFTKPFLLPLLFEEKPREQQGGRIPFWRCHQLADLSSSDIVIVEAPKYLIRTLPRQNAIVFSQHLDHILDVRGDWQDVRSRFRKSTRDYTLRLIRKYGYEYEISHDSQDFDEFYHQMYLPTTHDRHGEQSSPISVGEASRYFQHGCLFQVKRDGDWVSGVICHGVNRTLSFDVVGVKNANAQLIQEGATAALYFATINWANQNGYEAVNFLGSLAQLESGLFRHKRRWGTTVSVPANLHRLIWFGVRRNTPAVSQFLKDNPCVIVGEDGKLHGLIVTDEPCAVPAETRKEWEARYATPGLSSLIIRSASSFAEGSTSGDLPDLVIPLSPGTI
jgi:hypothetical protein